MDYQLLEETPREENQPPALKKICCYYANSIPSELTGISVYPISLMKEESLKGTKWKTMHT